MNSRIALHSDVECLSQVTARGEPGHRVGPAQDDGVLPGRVEKIANPAVLQLDIFTASPQFGLLVVGGGIGYGRQRVDVRPVHRGDADPITLVEELEIPRQRRDQTLYVNLGRHDAASMERRSADGRHECVRPSTQ